MQTQKIKLNYLPPPKITGCASCGGDEFIKICGHQTLYKLLPLEGVFSLRKRGIITESIIGLYICSRCGEEFNATGIEIF